MVQQQGRDLAEVIEFPKERIVRLVEVVPGQERSRFKAFLRRLIELIAEELRLWKD